jgi:hypothetical protein
MTSIPKASLINLNSLSFYSKFSVFSSFYLVPPVSSNHSKWIIDTVATDHMICSISLFTSITAKISTNVKLPNEKLDVVTHIGTVQIPANLLLTNGLCVLFFSFNLLFDRKLIKSIHCCFILFANFCFIQSLNNWMTIELGELQDDLYYLVRNPRASSSSNVATKFASLPSFFAYVKNVSVDLWHFRLGHLISEWAREE